jgi:hypothetical protein
MASPIPPSLSNKTVFENHRRFLECVLLPAFIDEHWDPNVSRRTCRKRQLSSAWKYQ